jgi:hypothetical protein
MPDALVGPASERTIFPRSYEVVVHDLYADVRRLVRARSPERALRSAQIEIDYELRLDLAMMPATVRRLDTGATWQKP